jgi:4-amino-4-deoxy-L-arabinose transferase-like glycosyltransferase
MTRPQKLDLLALLACLSLALAVRLPGLTVFLTADEARSWFGRSIIFLDSLARGDWANTAPGGEVSYLENVSLSPAPGVTTMWAGAVGILLEYLRQGMPSPLSQFLVRIPFDPLEPAILLSLRLSGVLMAVVAVGLTYWWSRPFLGGWGAFLAAGLLALDPFSLALSRVLGHDSLVSIFMWLSLLAFLRAMSGEGQGSNTSSIIHYSEPKASRGLSTIYHLPSTIFLLLSGAFAGLACLSKYPALFLGAFIAPTMLIVYLWQSNSSQYSEPGTPSEKGTMSPITIYQLPNILPRWLKAMLLWSLAAGVVFVLFWPAMWVDPLGTLATIFNDAVRASGGSHPKGSFFLGQPVPDPGWLFYPLVALLRTTPVVLVGLLLALWSLARRRIGDEHTPGVVDGATLIILLAYILFYTLLITVGGKKQDRYLLPIFPALAFVATIGYLHASRFTLHDLRFTWLFPSLLLLLQAAFVLPFYPYYFSFYNPLVGDGATAERLIQVGWGEGLNEAAAYLNTLPNAESLKVVSWYSTTFEPYFKGQTIYKVDEEKISRSPKPGLAADYVVFYVNQTQRQLPSEGVLQFFRSKPPIHTVTIDGIDYAWIYPSVRVQHIIGGEVRLVGQSELLGYNLTNEAGQPVTSAYPESVVFLSLFWEWQGQASGDELRVSLVDEANQTRGYGNPIETVAPAPRETWQDGMVARDDFALVIFPDTPPGKYRLAAWIDRPATGETVGVFPFEGNEVIIPIVPRAAGE